MGKDSRLTSAGKVMTVMLACLWSTVVCAAASGSHEATHATVEGLPAQVTSAVVREQEGKFTLTGSYTVDPAAGARLISFHAFAFSANWLEPRGAGWEQVVDTNAGARGTFQHVLTYRLSPGDRVLVTIRQLVGKKGTWLLPSLEFGTLRMVAKKRFAGEDAKLGVAEFKPGS